jgi:hypothetical protein
MQKPEDEEHSFVLHQIRKQQTHNFVLLFCLCPKSPFSVPDHFISEDIKNKSIRLLGRNQ